MPIENHKNKIQRVTHTHFASNNANRSIHTLFFEFVGCLFRCCLFNIFVWTFNEDLIVLTAYNIHLTKRTENRQHLCSKWHIFEPIECLECVTFCRPRFKSLNLNDSTLFFINEFMPLFKRWTTIIVLHSWRRFKICFFYVMLRLWEIFYDGQHKRIREMGVFWR